MKIHRGYQRVMSINGSYKYTCIHTSCEYRTAKNIYKVRYMV